MERLSILNPLNNSTSFNTKETFPLQPVGEYFNAATVLAFCPNIDMCICAVNSAFVMVFLTRSVSILRDMFLSSRKEASFKGDSVPAWISSSCFLTLSLSKPVNLVLCFPIFKEPMLKPKFQISAVGLAEIAAMSFCILENAICLSLLLAVVINRCTIFFLIKGQILSLIF